LPELNEEGKIILEPEAITDTRIPQLRNRSISEYLIKWRKLPAKDSTWEDESFIQKHPELLKHCGVVYPSLPRFTQTSQFTIHYMDLKTNAFNQN
jgi:hypothetical protein